MDFLLNDEQQMLRDLVERFVADRYPPAERPAYRIPAAGYDAANWSLLAELGILSLPFSADAGGFGGAPVDLMIVAEALGKGVVAEPVLSAVMMAGALIERAGSAEQREAWLPRIMAGEAHVGLAFAEPGARYAFDRIECRAEGGKLSGTKTFVMAGPDCDAFVVTAGGALWLVAGDAVGLTKRSYRLLDGSVALELELNDTPAEAMPGGMEAFRAHVQAMRVPIAAELTGLMALLFDLTLDYIKVRKQFGTSIGTFQAIQHRMAEQYVALEQSRSLLYRATLLHGDEAVAAGLAAKSYISAAAVKLGEEAIQLHGGMGVTDELLIGHAFKRVLLLSQLFGDPDTEALRYAAATH